MNELPSLKRQKWLKAPDVQKVLAALGDARIAGGAKAPFPTPPLTTSATATGAR